jgi:hypothetical protein
MTHLVPTPAVPIVTRLEKHSFLDDRQSRARLTFVVSKLFVIVLAFAVAFAVGICPCGLALAAEAVGSVGHVHAVAATVPHCQNCSGGDHKSSESDQNAPDPQKCSSVVSGDLPSSPTVPAALLAIPAVVQPLPGDETVRFASVVHEETARPGLPPPPTLLNLFCSLLA